MKEAEARDVNEKLKRPGSIIEVSHPTLWDEYRGECIGYLEAIDKAQMLEECIDGLICGTCDAETAEEVLRKWRRKK